MKKNSYIKISKLKPSAKPHYPTPNKKDFTPGADNGNVSLPVDYWAEGYLLSDIVIGKPILIDRRIRNGITADGFMNTSSIVKINSKAGTVETLNSVYKIEKAKDK